MLKKILIACAIALSMIGASAQNIYSITFRVEDKVAGRVSFERHEFDRTRKIVTVFDSLTNQLIMSATDYNGGRTTVIAAPGARVVVESDRNPETMRPDEEAFGTVLIEAQNLPPAKLSMHTKATKQGDLTVLETTAETRGYVTRARMAYATDYYRPVWQENITHIDGQKTRHDYLVPVN